jgi:hypothetical protein
MSVGMRSHASATIVLTRRIKTVSARHAEAFEALKHLFVLSSKARCELITQKSTSHPGISALHNVGPEHCRLR